MYIIIKQLSFAIPTKNRQKTKSQKLTVNTLATPPTNPMRFAPENDNNFYKDIHLNKIG